MSGPAPAPAVTSPLRVVNAWAIPSRNGQSRIYLDLMNPGFSAVDITGARIDLGGTAELRSTPDDTTATAVINVEAGQSVSFGPDGPFILVTDLPQPLNSGDRVVVTLGTISGEVTRFTAFVRTTPPVR